MRMHHLFISARPCPGNVLFFPALLGTPYTRSAFPTSKKKAKCELPCPLKLRSRKAGGEVWEVGAGHVDTHELPGDTPLVCCFRMQSTRSFTTATAGQSRQVHLDPGYG